MFLFNILAVLAMFIVHDVAELVTKYDFYNFELFLIFLWFFDMILKFKTFNWLLHCASNFSVAILIEFILNCEFFQVSSKFHKIAPIDVGVCLPCGPITKKKLKLHLKYWFKDFSLRVFIYMKICDQITESGTNKLN